MRKTIKIGGFKLKKIENHDYGCIVIAGEGSRLSVYPASLVFATWFIKMIKSFADSNEQQEEIRNCFKEVTDNMNHSKVIYKEVVDSDGFVKATIYGNDEKSVVKFFRKEKEE